MTKIHILQLLGSATGKKSTRGVGGAEVLVLQLAKNLDKKRFIVSVGYSGWSPLISEFRNVGVAIYYLRPNTKYDISFVMHLTNLIKRKGIDILQTHGLRLDFLSSVVSKLVKIPVIITRHVAISDHLENNLRKKVYSFFDRYSLSYAHRVVTVTRAVADDLISNQGIKPSKVSVIYNGVDLNKFGSNFIDIDAIKTELGLKRDYSVVGMVAQLVDFKGYPFFLKAASLVLKNNPKVYFLVVGKGPLQNELKNQAERLGIQNNVVFVGFCKDITKILSIMDIFTLSSLREGLPISMIEAMAAGKPVVATHVGGVPELVRDGVTGFIVLPRDSEALAEKIIELLNNKDKAEKMGTTGRKFVREKFSLERMIQEYESLYLQLTHNQ